MIAQEGAQQQIQMQYQFELSKDKQKLDAELMIELEKIASAERIALQTNQTKLAVAVDTGDAKIQAADIAGQHQQVKQSIANDKPQAPSKN